MEGRDGMSKGEICGVVCMDGFRSLRVLHATAKWGSWGMWKC